MTDYEASHTDTGGGGILFLAPSSNVDAITYSESRKVLSKQHASRSHTGDGVVMEIPCLSFTFRHRDVKADSERYVLFSHSGILEIPFQVPDPRWETFTGA